jgi:hypothetical protein
MMHHTLLKFERLLHMKKGSALGITHIYIISVDIGKSFQLCRYENSTYNLYANNLYRRFYLPLMYAKGKYNYNINGL